MIINNKRDFLTKICKYCVSTYQISNSAPIISDFIYYICKEVELDVPQVHGTVTLQINGSKKQFSHCFNVYNSIIVDASIYSLALINKSLTELLPLYIVGYPPYEIDYHIYTSIRHIPQVKFDQLFLNKVLSEIDNIPDINISKFNSTDDSKKTNLFFYK
ncbi:hypothetical protein D4Z93_08525 [Clostridium fermenticellae]|uniref:Uncharacterized protein n=1 Tax=Clostridium fermenticellae TaxID=2068654 RepID=A0A386H4A4_9CLOT|nr:hypothetical protein [Clostridium fermenticellae]AYD40571.1 hypothetical protein D4Z93_08525 [Clostridium fermenticellae]